MSDRNDSDAITTHVARLLRERNERVVFAESCTAGWVAALLSAEPGISAHLCGSLVTYRESCKQAWLGVEEPVLREHSAVSAPVTRQMALGALARSQEAMWSVAVTGHVGPGAPADLDGVCFMAIARRADRCPTQADPGATPGDSGGTLVDETRGQLASEARVERQREAAYWVLRRFRDALQSA